MGNSDTNRTRRSLLEGIKDPDNYRAWNRFHDTYAEMIRGWARRSGLRQDEAEDVAITVLVEISRKSGEFVYDPSKGRFRSFLSTITRRRALNKIRDRERAEERKIHRKETDLRKTGTLDREMTRLDGQPETDFEKLEEEEWRQVVMDQALKRVRLRVSPEQYQIFHAYVVLDWPVERVCKTYDIKRNQVYQAKKRVHPVLDKEVLAVASEIDNPTIPPEHPGLVR